MKILKLNFVLILTFVLATAFMVAPAKADDRIKVFEWKCILCEKIIYTLTQNGKYLLGGSDSARNDRKVQRNMVQTFGKGQFIDKCPKGDPDVSHAHLFERKSIKEMTPGALSRDSRYMDNLYVLRD